MRASCRGAAEAGMGRCTWKKQQDFSKEGLGVKELKILEASWMSLGVHLLWEGRWQSSAFSPGCRFSAATLPPLSSCHPLYPEGCLRMVFPWCGLADPAHLSVSAGLLPAYRWIFSVILLSGRALPMCRLFTLLYTRFVFASRKPRWLPPPGMQASCSSCWPLCLHYLLFFKCSL